MLGFAFFLSLPFLFSWIFGMQKVLPILAVSVGALLIVGLGFGVGLFLTYCFESPAYWDAYQLPTLWSQVATDHVSSGLMSFIFPMFILPLILLIDIVRIYFHFSFTHGTLALWLCEICSFYVLWKLFAMISRRRV